MHKYFGCKLGTQTNHDKKTDAFHPHRCLFPPSSLPLPTLPPFPPYPPDLLKFYGCELGAQTNYDKKTGTCIVNGAHDLRKLNELLEGFIKKYVQCAACRNPETTIKVKREIITLKCKACGAVGGFGGWQREGERGGEGAAGVC